jgi:Ala-tRNA(Pro) deacylase
VAKAIILQSQDGEYLMATLPSNNQLSIIGLSKMFGKDFHLVNEWLLNDLSPDYKQGATPSTGTAYKMRILIDNALLKAEQIYIAADDHRYLVKIDQDQYNEMQSLMPHTNICGSAISSPNFISKLSSKSKDNKKNVE